MKKKLILLAGVLAVGMCISSAACAEESSGSGIKDDIRALLEDETVQNALFGEDGLISEFLPEGTDMQTVEEQIGLVESQGAQLIDSIQSRIDSADGSFDVSSLENLAGQLMGAYTGLDFEGEDDFSAYLDTYTAINDAMKDFYIGNNAESMDLILRTFRLYLYPMPIRMSTMTSRNSGSSQYFPSQITARMGMFSGL